MRKIASRIAAGLLDDPSVANAVEEFTNDIRHETGLSTKYSSDGKTVYIAVRAKAVTVDFVTLTADADENGKIKGLIVSFPGNNGALRFELQHDPSGLARNQSEETLRLPEYLHL